MAPPALTTVVFREGYEVGGWGSGGLVGIGPSLGRVRGMLLAGQGCWRGGVNAPSAFSPGGGDYCIGIDF